MSKHRKLYKIEYLFEHPNFPNGSKWMDFTMFTCMQKSFAEGAFAMLKAHYGGEKKYRLVDSEGTIVDQWNTGKIVVN